MYQSFSGKNVLSRHVGSQPAVDYEATSLLSNKSFVYSFDIMPCTSTRGTACRGVLFSSIIFRVFGFTCTFPRNVSMILKLLKGALEESGNDVNNLANRPICLGFKAGQYFTSRSDFRAYTFAGITFHNASETLGSTPRTLKLGC